jgi:hypothetical protein
MKVSYKKGCVCPCWYASQVVTWGDEMYGGNCRALKDQLKDVQGIQVSRLGTDHFESKVRCFFWIPRPAAVDQLMCHQYMVIYIWFIYG